jgi:hypothetical protein
LKGCSIHVAKVFMADGVQEGPPSVRIAADRGHLAGEELRTDFRSSGVDTLPFDTSVGIIRPERCEQSVGIQRVSAGL